MANGMQNLATVSDSTGKGAAIGSAAGPWGALIGGVAGGITGIFQAIGNSQSENEKKRLINLAAQQYNTTAAEIEKAYQDYYAKNPSKGTQGDVDKYGEMIRTYDPTTYVYKPTEFGETYNKSVDEFVNPYKDEILKETARGVEASAAGKGLGRGTGAARAIAAAEINKNNELQKDAQQLYMQDRNMKYNEWNSYAQQMQNYLDKLNTNTQFQMQQYGNLADDYIGTQKEAFDTMQSLKADAAKTNLQLQLSKV